MEFVPLLVLSSLVKKLTDFLKYALNADVNAIVTQIAAWLIGVAVAFVGAKSDWGHQLAVNGINVADLNNWSLLLVGVNLASLAGVGWDVIKAVDSSNSAAVPNLLRQMRVRQGTEASPEPAP